MWVSTSAPRGGRKDPRDRAHGALTSHPLSSVPLHRVAEVALNETTRLYFERMARVEQGQLAADMKAVLADASITVSPERLDTPSPLSPLDPELVRVIETLTAKFWPGIPVLPTMSAGATDSRFLRNAAIPAYGHSGLASDIFDVRAHGKDERIAVDAFYRGPKYLHELVRALAAPSQAQH